MNLFLISSKVFVLITEIFWRTFWCNKWRSVFDVVKDSSYSKENLDVILKWSRKETLEKNLFFLYPFFGNLITDIAIMLIGDDCNWGTKYLRQNWLQFDRVFRGLNLLRCLFVCVLFAHKAVEVLKCPTILPNHSFLAQNVTYLFA